MILWFCNKKGRAGHCILKAERLTNNKWKGVEKKHWGLWVNKRSRRSQSPILEEKYYGHFKKQEKRRHQIEGESSLLSSIWLLDKFCSIYLLIYSPSPISSHPTLCNNSKRAIWVLICSRLMISLQFRLGMFTYRARSTRRLSAWQHCRGCLPH